MPKLILSVLILMGSGAYLERDTCKCKKLTMESVSEGAEEKRVEDYVYKDLSGQITALGDSRPIENILVEVYDHPEVVLDSDDTSAKRNGLRQKRVASCRTGKNGMFCFKGIKPGKYEVRLIDDGFGGRSTGPWENRSWFITFDPSHPASTKRMIDVYLTLRI